MQWQKCLGGSKDEFANSIIKTSDSCYVITGMTMSDDGDVSVNHGLPNTNDAWLIKVDLSGNILWEVTYGGPNGDYGQHVIETSDKGFFITGSTYSNAGQVIGNNGALDVWVIKTDSLGTLEWQHCYGGSFLDAGYKTVEVNNHYYLLGYNLSNDGDVTNNHPDPGSSHQASADAWLICIDSIGILQWEKSYGGSFIELGLDLLSFNNFLFIACESSSNDGDVSNNHSNYADYWLIQTDLQGNILWQSCYGGSYDEFAESILVENNHLYALGYSDSNDGDVSGNHGGIDFWLIDLNIDSLINSRSELLSERKIIIFPNPANDKLNINIYEEAQMILEDVNGKIIIERKINYSLTEDVRELPNGIYIVKIISKKHIQYNKLFIIQH